MKSRRSTPRTHIPVPTLSPRPCPRLSTPMILSPVVLSRTSRTTGEVEFNGTNLNIRRASKSTPLAISSILAQSSFGVICFYSIQPHMCSIQKGWNEVNLSRTEILRSWRNWRIKSHGCNSRACQALRRVVDTLGIYESPAFPSKHLTALT